MLKRTKVLVGTGVAVVALGGTGAGVALADSSTPAPPSSSTPAPAPKKHHGLLTRVDHGEVTLKGKKHRVLDVQRGQVQAVSPTSITVKSDDGFTATYTVDQDTKVKKAKQDAAIDKVAQNDKVTVVATKDGSTLTAKRLNDATS